MTAVDQTISLIASRQHGVVSRAQLLAEAVGRRAVDLRLSDGRLHPIHRGVYAVGHGLVGRNGRWMAAVLAGGPAAVLSHMAAAELWGIVEQRGRRPEVTLKSSRRSSPAITFHSSALPRDEITVRSGILTTTVPRTLLDIAPRLSHARLSKAVDDAEATGPYPPPSLLDLCNRYVGRRGTRSARRVIDESRIGVDVPRRELEIRFAELIERHELVRPERNALVDVGEAVFEVDCLWRNAGLIVELDSRRFHQTRAAFEGDRARDRALTALGWRVIRVTWRQLHSDEPRLVADLRFALASGGRSPALAG